MRRVFGYLQVDTGSRCSPSACALKAAKHRKVAENRNVAQNNSVAQSAAADVAARLTAELEALRAEGLCRSIGVSNYGIHHLEELLAVCTVPPCVNQVRDISVWCLHAIDETGWFPHR